MILNLQTYTGCFEREAHCGGVILYYASENVFIGY